MMVNQVHFVCTIYADCCVCDCEIAAVDSEYVSRIWFIELPSLESSVIVGCDEASFLLQ